MNLKERIEEMKELYNNDRMNLLIIKADNGWVLQYIDENGMTKYIAVEEDDEGSEARTTRKLLWEIQEHFCLFGSKHDDEQVFVILKNREGKESA